MHNLKKYDYAFSVNISTIKHRRGQGKHFIEKRNFCGKFDLKRNDLIRILRSTNIPLLLMLIPLNRKWDRTSNRENKGTGFVQNLIFKRYLMIKLRQII